MILKKTMIMLIILSAAVTIVTAQNPPEAPFSRKGMNNSFLEIGGNGGFLTLNYERFLTEHIGLRLGGLVLPTGEGVSYVGTVMGTVLLGKEKLCPEIGLGVMVLAGGYMDIATDGVDSFALLGTATIGFRYQPKRRGFLFRFGFTPIFGRSGVLSWVGLSFGWGHGPL